MTTPGPLFVGMLAVWLLVKVIYVEAIIPAHNRNREPRAKGELLASLVPEGKTLYLFRLKDEGIMFYYGRSVRRLASPAQIPSEEEPAYCILDETELHRWQSLQGAEVIWRLRDQQGDPIALVKTSDEKMN